MDMFTIENKYYSCLILNINSLVVGYCTNYIQWENSEIGHLKLLL